MRSIKLMFAGTLAIALTAVGCKKDTDGPNGTGAPNAKTFQVRMTDAPGDFKALDVEILSVEAYLENQGWVTLNNQAQAVSVLDLTNGTETQLAFASNAQIGTYTKLKLTFSENNTLVTNANGGFEIGPISGNLDLTFDLAYEGSKEVIIEINETVTAQSGASVLLDFQVAQSIRKGLTTYIINPAIVQVENEMTGINGRVQGTANAAVLLTNGEDTLSTFIDAQGTFLIRGMKQGTYDLIVAPETDQDPTNDEFRVDGLFITEGQISSAGVIQL